MTKMKLLSLVFIVTFVFAAANAQSCKKVCCLFTRLRLRGCRWRLGHQSDGPSECVHRPSAQFKWPKRDWLRQRSLQCVRRHNFAQRHKAARCRNRVSWLCSQSRQVQCERAKRRRSRVRRTNRRLVIFASHAFIVFFNYASC